MIFRITVLLILPLTCTGPIFIDSDSDCTSLVSPFSDKEIHNVVISFGSGKSLGPDVFNHELYKSYWSILSPYFHYIFYSFYNIFYSFFLGSNTCDVHT